MARTPYLEFPSLSRGLDWVDRCLCLQHGLLRKGVMKESSSLAIEWKTHQYSVMPTYALRSLCSTSCSFSHEILLAPQDPATLLQARRGKTGSIPFQAQSDDLYSYQFTGECETLPPIASLPSSIGAGIIDVVCLYKFLWREFFSWSSFWDNCILPLDCISFTATTSTSTNTRTRSDNWYGTWVLVVGSASRTKYEHLNP
eukprot:scaffold19272_cov50-Prasinocladus_malaysianus.AAC.1